MKDCCNTANMKTRRLGKITMNLLGQYLGFRNLTQLFNRILFSAHTDGGCKIVHFLACCELTAELILEDNI